MASLRIHLLSHGNPLGPEVVRFGFEDVEDYVTFVAQHLPAPYSLTYDLKVLKAVEEPWHGGRNDDDARVRDLQRALGDKRTVALVAANGGAYFSRLLPHLRFDVLAKRTAPLWALGFSEMSTLVNLVASYRCGHGMYWLCPNWMGWRLTPPEAARAALAEFWRVLPELFAGRVPTETQHVPFGPITGTVQSGRALAGRIRIAGGCLAVLAAAVGGTVGKRLKPDGKWLLLEDVKESPYRIDRHLAALKLAGWFDRCAGLIIGDFHMLHEDTQPAVLELLKYHLPKARKLPVVTTRNVGHVWPLVPVLLNRPVTLRTRGREVWIDAAGVAAHNTRRRSL
ncbi:MAG: LD-carboxypeptidase [Phycisphaerales bacterium]|nr:LD-carboxypeptidase [Phycisphaerales bacterium]